MALNEHLKKEQKRHLGELKELLAIPSARSETPMATTPTPINASMAGRISQCVRARKVRTSCHIRLACLTQNYLCFSAFVAPATR